MDCLCSEFGCDQIANFKTVPNFRHVIVIELSTLCDAIMMMMVVVVVVVTTMI